MPRSHFAVKALKKYSTTIRLQSTKYGKTQATYPALPGRLKNLTMRDDAGSVNGCRT